MKEPQLSGIAKALAAQGRKGDTELLHVSKDELAALRKHGAALGINLTTNPATGLPEAFNWGGMLGSVGLPLLLTVATGGMAAPWMALAGAAGGAGGTLLGGGSTDQALVSGLMGGIGGYGMGGLGESLAAAGTEAAAAETAKQAASNVAADTASQSAAQVANQGLTTSTGQIIAPGTLEGAASSISQAPMGADVTQLIPKGYELGSGQLGNQVAALQGNAPLDYAGAVGTTVDPAARIAAPTGIDAISKGWSSVTSSPEAFGSFAMDQAKNIGMTGIGALGAGSSLNPQEQTLTTEPESTENPYKGEMYMDPATGQWRSRAVRRARGGEIYGDYEGVEEAPDGGYAPGGGLNFAEGGTSSAAGDIASGIATPETLAIFEAGKKLGPSRRRREDQYAGGGGIGDLGGYSDGGRLLRGPGDGISDNIPATIEGKRPARLADGEFVVPARAVSELGNGSTEAGSKQLYKMLDRIAAKRKSGKGLAYESNPKKLLPA